MNKQLADITSRRRRLLLEIDAQRMEVAAISQRWRKPLAVADLGLKAIRVIREHPVWATGGATALLAFRNNGISGIARHSWRMLYLYPSAILIGLKYLASAIQKPHGAHDKPAIRYKEPRNR